MHGVVIFFALFFFFSLAASAARGCTDVGDLSVEAALLDYMVKCLLVGWIHKMGL